MNSGKKTWQCDLSEAVSSLRDLESIILKHRGLIDHQAIQKFLHPSLSDLSDPSEIRGIEVVLDRIFSAIKNQERIVVFGDFDTDGITSTVILVSALRNLGAEVSYRIPERNADSHGLKKYLLDELFQKNVRLIITCDSGTNDCDEVAYAQSLGMDVIVTDHHVQDVRRFPVAALAVINPQIEGSGFADKNLSGAGVAFKIASALAESALETPEEIVEFLEPLLEICAIGTVADCVPLLGENRILVRAGLEKMKQTRWPGLRALLSSGNVDLSTIDENTIAFFLAPRINAASRIGDVTVAVQLFLGDDASHIRRVAQIEQWNEVRKQLTEKTFEESQEQICLESSCQVLFGSGWSAGILGLVASRHSDQLSMPTIVCTLREDQMITGSCRAPHGFSMVASLEGISEHFTFFGGHAGAAGFVAPRENFEKIKQGLENHFRQIKNEIQKVRVEAFIHPRIVTGELLDFLKHLSPFGAGNPSPIFGIHDFEVSEVSEMGSEKNHLRFSGMFDGVRTEFVAFFAQAWRDEILPGARIDILFTISENTWRGQKRTQLKVMDVRAINN